MAARQVELNVIALSSAVSAAHRGGRWFRAVGLFQQLKSRSLRPDLPALTAAMGAAATGLLWKSAIDILQSASRHQLEVAQSQLNSGLTALTRGRQWQLSISALNLAVASGDGVSHNAAMAAADGGTWPMALSHFARVQDWGLRADVITCTTGISSCSDAWIQAAELFAILRTLGEEPTEVTINAAISAFGKGTGAGFAFYIQRRNAEFDESSVPAPEEEPAYHVVDNATQIFQYDAFLSSAEVSYLLTFAAGHGWGPGGHPELELPVEGYIAAARQDPIISRIEQRIANHTGIPSHPHEDILGMVRMTPHALEPRGGHFPAAGLRHDSDSRPHRSWTMLVFLEVPTEGGRIIFPLAGPVPREGELGERHRHFVRGLQEQFGGAKQNYSRSVRFDPGSDHPFMDLIEESCRGNYGVAVGPLQPGAALLFPSDSRSQRTWYGECNVINGSKVTLRKYKELPLEQRDPEVFKQDWQVTPEFFSWDALSCTYACCPSCALACSQWQRSFCLLGQARESAAKSEIQTGLAPGFSALLLACTRSSAWQEAFWLWSELQSSDEGPRAVNSFSALIRECEQQGWEGMEDGLLEQLRSEWLWAQGSIVAPLPLLPRYPGQWKAELRLPTGPSRGPMLQPQPRAGRMPVQSLGAAGSAGSAAAPYSKELRLLSHVLRTATAGSPQSVCESIEGFGSRMLGQSRSWLKLAGGSKAPVLTCASQAAPPHTAVLEIGTYCGYSSLRLALAVPGAKIATADVDPAHVLIARNVLAFGGLEPPSVTVWTGHSTDLLPQLSAHYRPGTFGFVFMDQRGSLYHEDLHALESAGLLHPGAVLLADNVLKPGAPLLLWRLLADPKYEALQLAMQEFAMPVEDWMALAVIKDMTARQPQAPAPKQLRALHEFSDEIRARALIPGRGIDFQEWKDLAAIMKRGLQELGITAVAVSPMV
ncbi:COMT [Symbiodinium natans]|uniref:catechol O-methyltransferase n=1 Tax=Symbiodinium natans TaxID=878477 RepID=A0A812NSZ6_9DINO|nr:COMT [Symbiodinium natans]